MTITVKIIQNVAVISLIGKLTIGEGDVTLREFVYNLLEGGHIDIVANLNQVSTLDSEGAAELVSAYTSVSKRGGNFKLCKLSPKVYEILQITQLITVFEVFDTEQEAVDSF